MLSIYVHRQCELSKCHRSNWDALSISCINTIVVSILLILLLTNSCSYGRIYSRWYTMIYWCIGSGTFTSYTNLRKCKDCITTSSVTLGWVNSTAIGWHAIGQIIILILGYLNTETAQFCCNYNKVLIIDEATSPYCTLTSDGISYSVNWERFAELNFHCFHGVQEHCKSFSVNITLK